MIDVKNGEWQMIELTIVRLTFETFDMVWAEPPNICEDIDIITYLNFFEHVWLPVHNLKWFISGCKATVWGFSYLKNMPYSYDVEWCYQFSDSVCRLEFLWSVPAVHWSKKSGGSSCLVEWTPFEKFWPGPTFCSQHVYLSAGREGRVAVWSYFEPSQSAESEA